jgi:hypothetical protein
VHGDAISGPYHRSRGDSGVFRGREATPRSAHRTGSPRSRRRAVAVFSALAACEIAGAVGLVLGIWWPVLGMAAGVGLVVYFVGAVVSHLRVGDMKGIGPAAFLLMVSVAALVLRVLMHKTGAAG